MQIIIQPEVEDDILEFYENTMLAHPHTWSEEDVIKSSDKVYDEIWKIGNLLKTKVSIPDWREKGYSVKRSGNWYFAYQTDVNGNIVVYHAKHAQNMTPKAHQGRTDGNYDPQQQFVTDNKMRIKPKLTEAKDDDYWDEDDVERWFKKKMNDRDFEKTIKKIVSKCFEDWCSVMYHQRHFLKNQL